MVNKKYKRAFSLIELVIVMAVLGVLASIAIPLYSGYAVRAKVVEGLKVLEILKQKSMDYYNENGDLPGNLADISVGAKDYATDFIDRANISNGLIIVYFTSVAVPSSNSSSLGAILLQPTVSAGIITWSCKGSNIPNNYLPSNCAN